MIKQKVILVICMAAVALGPSAARAEGKWEVTPASQHASEEGLKYLARTQGPAGNWNSKDLGLVALGVLAFLSAGHTPDIGPYGQNVRRGLDYIISNQKPSGLLNIAADQRDNYNHGLATFVLTQAYGMSKDPRIGKALDKALRLIMDVQCKDGGWGYKAERTERGHDLSLCVMQAKALRGAMDVGMEIPPQVVDMAIKAVRRLYKPDGKPDGKGALYGSDPLAARPGQFTYDGNRATPACGSAGAVCLQEFGQYGDFRIKRSLDAVVQYMDKEQHKWAKGGEYTKKHVVPMGSAYTLYYFAQALYQVGGDRWRKYYPGLRDGLVATQTQRSDRSYGRHGQWESGQHGAGGLFGTAVAVLVLNIPNRYLPILQQGVGHDVETPAASSAASRRPTTPAAAPTNATNGERR